MSHPDRCSSKFYNEDPWSKCDNVIWLGSTLRLYRNLEKFNFPHKLPEDKQQQIAGLLSKGLLSLPSLNQAKVFRADELLPVEKEYLVEHFLSDRDFQLAQSRESFVIDETGDLLAVLNFKDHLILEGIDTHEELEGTWDRLVKIELELSKTINFAFSPRFGFLTSDPSQCGTGFVGTVFLHLPALLHTHRLEDIIKEMKDHDMGQTGIQGDPNEMIGDIVAFHNRHTLGLTEENILSSLRSLAVKLVAEEKGVRRHLKQANEQEVADMKNKVSRAFGVLLHSYQMDAVEVLQALSLVKMGLDLEWVKGVPQSVFNYLLFACRRAHLLCLHGNKIPQEEVSHRRAEYLHKALRGLELLI